MCKLISGRYSPQDFLNSKDNPIVDEKTGQREYTEGYQIATNKAQDKEAIAGFMAIEKQDYNVITSNCAQAVQNGLGKAGKNVGNMTPLVFGAKYAVYKTWAEYSAMSPNSIYDRIKDQNKGKVFTANFGKVENKGSAMQQYQDMENSLNNGTFFH